MNGHGTSVSKSVTQSSAFVGADRVCSVYGLTGNQQNSRKRAVEPVAQLVEHSTFNRLRGLAYPPNSIRRFGTQRPDCVNPCVFGRWAMTRGY